MESVAGQSERLKDACGHQMRLIRYGIESLYLRFVWINRGLAWMSILTCRRSHLGLISTRTVLHPSTSHQTRIRLKALQMRPWRSFMPLEIQRTRTNLDVISLDGRGS